MNVRERAIEILMQNNLPLGHAFDKDENLVRSIAEANLDALEKEGIVVVSERHDEIFWHAFHGIQDALDLLQEYERERLEAWPITESGEVEM